MEAKVTGTLDLEPWNVDLVVLRTTGTNVEPRTYNLEPGNLKLLCVTSSGQPSTHVTGLADTSKSDTTACLNGREMSEFPPSQAQPDGRLNTGMLR